MWRINDDEILGQLGQAVADVNAVQLGWPVKPRKAELPAENEIWLAPARDGELGPWAHKKPARPFSQG